MNSIRPILRYGTAAISFGLIVWLFTTMPFGERGYHFLPEAAAEERRSSEDYDLSKLRILTRCVGYVRSYYVDPARVDPREMLASAFEAVQRMLPPLLVRIEREGDETTPPTRIRVTLYEESQDFEIGKVTDLYEMNWKMLDIFDFIERRLRRTDRLPSIEYAAINGMLQTLDPHSVLLDPDTYREMKLGTSGEFGGLGIVISIREGHLSVVSVIEDTPAYEAGLKSGDRIVQVGEESTVNMTLNDAVNRLRGKPGSRVTLWIGREGWAEPRSFSIERDNITIRSAVGRPLGRGVGYVRIKHFQQNTHEELQQELTKLRTSGHWKGLILDLRDDPGGLLDQAIQVSDAFLADGTIVTTVGAGSRLREEKKATRADTIADVPLVVLVNGGSASASEIVAGALKNNGRALLLGDRTFGKGSVQVLYDIDDAALKLTIAQYLTPGDQSIQSVGIVPDVRMLPVVASKDHVDLYVTDRDQRGERDLPKHLVHLSARADAQPAILLKYLAEEEDSAASPSETEPKEDVDFHKDKLIRFAEALLTRATSADRDEMLAVARGLFADLSADEERGVRGEIEKLGVDWRPAPQPEVDAAQSAKLHVEAIATPAGPVRAGGEATITVTVRNDGDRPIHRVHGISRSTAPRFDDRELLFGRLAPGETRSWSLPVQVARSADSRYDEVWVDLFSDGRPLNARAVASVEIQALERPRFAYSVQVRDEAQGNGDGLVQRGERFGLRLRIRNVGEGPTFKAVAGIKNLNGETVYIHQGRRRFKDLAPAADVTLDFDLEVKPTLEDDEIRIEVNVIDTTLREQLKREIVIPVGPPSTGGSHPVELAGSVRGSGTSVYAGADRAAGVLGGLAGGDVVRADASANGFLRVSLAEGDIGWVDESAVEPLPPTAPVEIHFVPNAWILPPVFDIAAAHPVPRYTATETVTLDVTVRFPAGDPGERRMIYVYRDDDKLAFEEHEAKGGEALAIPVRLDIPVEPGSNTITIFARIGEATPAYRTFVVDRAGKAPDELQDVR